MKASFYGEDYSEKNEFFIKRKHFSGTPEDTADKPYLPLQILQEAKLRNRKHSSMKTKLWIRDIYSHYKLQVGKNIIQPLEVFR